MLEPSVLALLSLRPEREQGWGSPQYIPSHLCLSGCTLCTQFPRMAELVGITPFEFRKSLEYVGKVEPQLPKALLLHLMHVEDMILEEYAWKSGSELFEVSVYNQL